MHFSASPALALPPSESVTDTHNRHNLSATGPGVLGVTRDAQQKQICIFCHTPHHSTLVTPLWSRQIPDELTPDAYTPYVSTTIPATARPGQPTGASRLCLSCHDGTIALGMLADNRQISTLPKLPETRSSNLSQDLSNDHPVSFSYAAAASASASTLKQPADLPVEIALENGRLECTACHNPHRDLYPPVNKPLESGKFLVLDNNINSALCTACHSRAGLTEGAHFLATPGDSCGKCHAPHNAPQPQRLLKGAVPQDNCLASCHNGSGPGSDIKTSLTLLFAHRTSNDPLSGSHDAAENPQVFTSANSHVECVDCHNPCLTRHETASLSSPPWINGRLAEVTLVRAADGTRTIATREYEICFKCHADTPFAPPAVPRQTPFPGTGNEPARFSQDNPSYHPVMAAVDTTKLAPEGSRSRRLQILGTSRSLTVESMIYCSDCHNPHASPPPIEHLLVADYRDTFPQTYNYQNYELCFRCHDEQVLLDPARSAFPFHKSHVAPDASVDPLGRHTGKETPCTICHDPHGVPVTMGGTTTANAHLINFTTLYGITGSYDSSAKSCTVSCHSTGNPNPQTHSYL